MIKVIPFIYDDIDDLCANTFILIDSNKYCVIIDPSSDYPGIVNYINKNSLEPKAILLTHGHIDHLKGINRLYNEFKLPIYISRFDANSLTDDELNCKKMLHEHITLKFGDFIQIDDGTEIDLLSETIKVIATPYHTIGSVCYYVPSSSILFTGDTLFKKMIGRDDFPNSCPEMRKESLNKIIALKDETKIYPGHGQLTTLKEERISNPFIYR